MTTENYPLTIYLEPKCGGIPDAERRWSTEPFEMCSPGGCEHCNEKAPAGVYRREN
jgi:hypothetical protein